MQTNSADWWHAMRTLHCRKSVRYRAIFFSALLEFQMRGGDDVCEEFAACPKLILATFLAKFVPNAHAEATARQALRDAGMKDFLEFAEEDGAQVNLANMPQN